MAARASKSSFNTAARNFVQNCWALSGQEFAVEFFVAEAEGIAVGAVAGSVQAVSVESRTARIRRAIRCTRLP